MAPGVSRSVTIRIAGNRSRTSATSRSYGPERHQHVRPFGVDLVERVGLSSVAPGASSHSAETVAALRAGQRLAASVGDAEHDQGPTHR